MNHSRANVGADYTAAACSPTRAMLLSGTDNHISGVGVMSEQKGRDPDRWNVPGHEGFLKYVLIYYYYFFDHR